MNSRIFRVDPTTRAVDELPPTTFSDQGFLETKDIHEWLASNPGMLGEQLLVIHREHVGVEGSRRRPDILAVDNGGNLAIVEVKRDDSGLDICWQATLYAASYWPRSGSDLIDMFADFSKFDRSEALRTLMVHTDSEDEEDLKAKLNKKQRIILVSRTFPKEVTTAVLWLREQGTIDISCLQLTPHHDSKTGAHYLQCAYVIPVPEREALMVELRNTQKERAVQEDGVDVRRSDDITKFMLEVYDQLQGRLGADLMPSKKSRFAGIDGTTRYFKLWYAKWPWSNHNFCFALVLETEPGGETSGGVDVYFNVYITDVRARDMSEAQIAKLRMFCKKLHGHSDLEYTETQATFSLGRFVPADGLSQKGAADTAAGLADLIQIMMPTLTEILCSGPTEEAE